MRTRARLTCIEGERKKDRKMKGREELVNICLGSVNIEEEKKAEKTSDVFSQIIFPSPSFSRL